MAGPDGNVWFVENGIFNKVGKITPDGVISEFPFPNSRSAITNIAVGSDGNIWFADLGTFKIGRVTPAGVITEFSIPTANSNATSMAAGPDGNLWFVEQTATTIGRVGTKIGRITTAGVITEFATPTPNSDPSGIFIGPDGNVWFLELAVNDFVRIDTAGPTFTEVVPVPALNFANLGAVANGSDGNFWLTTSNQIDRMTTAGSVTSFTIPTANSKVTGMAAGSDGNIWFVEPSANKIGRVNGVGPPATGVTIPVAASIHGAGGSFFHSDVRVFNRSNTDSVTVTAKYHCFAPPCGNSPQSFMLSPREMRAFDDMIAVTFNAAESGGAIEFSSNGSLVVNSRVYTPSRPAPTYGMGVPGIPESQAIGVSVLTSLSHSTDPTKGFRSNLGAYNPNDIAQTITFTLYDGSGTQLGQTTAAAPARTSVQVSNIFNVIGITTDVPSAYCVVAGDKSLPLLTYAGVIDNQSQDLTYIQGLPDSRPAGPDRATIPVAASIHGVGGSFFHTDATALNLSSSATANVTARYHCFSGSCGNATQTFALAPRQMRSFDDMIASLFSAPESGGAIQFDSDQPIVVNSRVYNPSRPAPTYGMGVPGLPETGEPTTAVLISLSYSANLSQGFRSNVGAYNPNDLAQTITFTLYDPAGTQLGQASANAPARTSVQISNVFAVAGFTLDVPNAYCTVQGDQNLPLLVYAGVIDNQSQDLTFIKGENGLPP